MTISQLIIIVLLMIIGGITIKDGVVLMKSSHSMIWYECGRFMLVCGIVILLTCVFIIFAIANPEAVETLGNILNTKITR